jgi:hypothetical protein
VKYGIESKIETSESKKYIYYDDDLLQDIWDQNSLARMQESTFRIKTIA